jgi:hypothetical protein
MGAWPQSLGISIAMDGCCRCGKDAAGSRPPKSSSSLGTPTVSIAATTARYKYSSHEALRIRW